MTRIGSASQMCRLAAAFEFFPNSLELTAYHSWHTECAAAVCTVFAAETAQMNCVMRAS